MTRVPTFTVLGTEPNPDYKPDPEVVARVDELYEEYEWARDAVLAIPGYHTYSNWSYLHNWAPEEQKLMIAEMDAWEAWVDLKNTLPDELLSEIETMTIVENPNRRFPFADGEFVYEDEYEAALANIRAAEAAA